MSSAFPRPFLHPATSIPIIPYIWLRLASSLRCIHFACLDCSFLFVCLQDFFFSSSKLNVLTVKEIKFFSQKCSASSCILTCSLKAPKNAISLYFELLSKFKVMLIVLGIVPFTASDEIRDDSKRKAQGSSCLYLSVSLSEVITSRASQ